jgi:uncharacterized protein (DUF2345 family)
MSQARESWLHCNSLKEHDKVKVQAKENNLELTNEEIRTWKNNNERIQVIGVRSINLRQPA